MYNFTISTRMEPLWDFSHNIQEIKVCERQVVRLFRPALVVRCFYCGLLLCSKKIEAGRMPLICAHLWPELTFTHLQLNWNAAAGFLHPDHLPEAISLLKQSQTVWSRSAACLISKTNKARDAMCWKVILEIKIVKTVWRYSLFCCSCLILFYLLLLPQIVWSSLRIVWLN